MSTAFDTCALCPRLCRVACPVATLTAREAAVPTQIAEVLRGWREGRVSDALARASVTLCVDCGRCQERCHIDQPLPAALREARRELLGAKAPTTLSPIVGASKVVAVLTDDRDWSAALAVHRRAPVALWRTADQLGETARGGPGWQAHLDAVRAQASGRELVVAHGAVAVVLGEAGVPYRWLHEVLGREEVRCGCAGPGDGGPSCCGGAGPLAEHHPADAARMARKWLAAGPDRVVADARCAGHLARVGLVARSLVDEAVEG